MRWRFGFFWIKLQTLLRGMEGSLRVMDRDVREDKAQLKSLIAANKGVVTNEMLDQFHPEAAPGPMDANILFEKVGEMINE